MGTRKFWTSYVKIMAADGLAIDGARSRVAMIFVWWFWDGNPVHNCELATHHNSNQPAIDLAWFPHRIEPWTLHVMTTTALLLHTHGQPACHVDHYYDWAFHKSEYYSLHAMETICALNQLPLDLMAANSQTIFSDAFSWTKSFIFLLKFHWSLFLRVQLIITQHCFR